MSGAGKPAEGEVSPRRPRVMRSLYPCAIPLLCATTSRMSQRAQALGFVQASAGRAVRYCCSRADSVWTTWTSAACVPMLFPLLAGACRTHGRHFPLHLGQSLAVFLQIEI